MKATRAEIEMIAIAMYESHRRLYVSPQPFSDWWGLKLDDRKEWRMRAQRLLAEEKL